LRADYRAFDKVRKLTNVSRPTPLHEQVQVVSRDFQSRFSKLPTESVCKIADQLRHILAAFPQGRNANWEHAQTEKQVLSKLPIRHESVEIPVRGRDNPDIDFDRFRAAQSLNCPILQNTEKFRLQFMWNIPDFIQQESAAVSMLKVTDSLREGPCESTSLMTKKLTLKESRWDCRAVGVNSGSPSLDYSRSL
jgi:hypothetical protein